MQRPGVLLATCCVSLLLNHCSGPYAPQQQPDPLQIALPPTDPVVAAESGRLYAINPGEQACNPSISQDQVNYPACMLWLNAGKQNVQVPAELSGYLANEGEWHNRLSIVDTSNTLRWYVFKTDIGVAAGGQLQGPEWSTHPDYLTCVAADVRPDDKHAYALAVRLSDKAHLQLTQPILTLWGYPHIYVPDTARATATVDQAQFDQNGLVTRDCVRKFFGTTDVKLVFAFQCNSSLRFVDYRETAPVPHTLRKPAGKENWVFLSALISPDGKWVVYDCFPGVEELGPTYACYLQALRPDAEPLLIAEGACDPHWWVDPDNGSCHVVYAQLTGHYFVEDDLADTSVIQDTLLGTTVRQRLNRAPEDGALSIDNTSTPRIIAPLPMKGGLSLDGKILCTGYKFAYMYRLPD
jgi:hypothetical protein